MERAAKSGLATWSSFLRTRRILSPKSPLTGSSTWSCESIPTRSCRPIRDHRGWVELRETHPEQKGKLGREEELEDVGHSRFVPLPAAVPDPLDPRDGAKGGGLVLAAHRVHFGLKYLK